MDVEHERNGQSEKCLELLTYWGRSTSQALNFLTERILNKTQTWKQRPLFEVGHEILMKFDLTAIPTYSLACFFLSKSFCRFINGIIARF